MNGESGVHVGSFLIVVVVFSDLGGVFCFGSVFETLVITLGTFGSVFATRERCIFFGAGFATAIGFSATGSSAAFASTGSGSGFLASTGVGSGSTAGLATAAGSGSATFAGSTGSLVRTNAG